MQMPDNNSQLTPKALISVDIFEDIAAHTRDWPKITVVTPSFNQGEYIEDTILSVLSQGYPNIEYIVMDGASSDNTISVLNRYSDKLSYCISEKDAGQSDAINKGFALSTGDIIGWLNSDDKLAPGSLFALAESFRVSGADIVAGVVDIVRNGELLHRHRTGLVKGPLPRDRLLDLWNEWLKGRFFYQPEVYISRRALNSIGTRVDDSLYYSMDYDLWVRLAEAGATIAPIDWTIAEFRVHAEQKTSSTEAYLPELTSHNARLRNNYGLEPLERDIAQRPKRSARIGMISDFGFSYGAGRAHRRIASVLASAGMHVSAFALNEDKKPTPAPLDNAVCAMAAFQPDVIIVGNLHGVLPEGADLLPLADIAPLLVVTHDFFWFTGRCPYPGGCKQYLELCSSKCPTRDEYPVIPYKAIPIAHARKMDLWRSPRVHFAANSQYMLDWAFAFLSRQDAGAEARLKRIYLGVPEAEYRPSDRRIARRRYELTDNDFVVLVSSTSVRDPRKRFQHVLEACRLSGVRNLQILAMGNIDDSERLSNIKYTGYLESDEDIATCFNAADVFVGASSDETYGQTFVEAAQCGCPSIAYNVGALRETIIEGETGWLVADGDMPAMAARLAEFAADPQRHNSIRERVYINARSTFGAPTMLQSLQEALRALVDNTEVHIPCGAQFGGHLAQPITWLESQIWRTSTGYTDIEGPFLELGIERKLTWQTEPEAFLEVRVAIDGLYELTIECETLASDQVIDIEIGGHCVRGIELQPSYWKLLKVIRLTASLSAGWNTFRIKAEKYIVTDSIPRRLAVFEISCAPASVPDKPPELSRRLGLQINGQILDREIISFT
jgi:glycosyltransferase involved in cell wall biosynthesis